MKGNSKSTKPQSGKASNKKLTAIERAALAQHKRDHEIEDAVAKYANSKLQAADARTYQVCMEGWRIEADGGSNEAPELLGVVLTLSPEEAAALARAIVDQLTPYRSRIYSA